MTPDVRRRLDALEARREPTTYPEGESPKDQLLRKMGLLDPPRPDAPRWEHFDADAIALEVRHRIAEVKQGAAQDYARLESLDAGTVPYPPHISTPERRRMHRETLASSISSAAASVRLLTEVLATAEAESGRAVEEHPDSRLLRSLANSSIAELVTLHIRYRISTALTQHRTESETPT